jgi:TolB protein
MRYAPNNTFVVMALLTCIMSAAGCHSHSEPGEIAMSRLTGDYWQLWTMHPDGSGLQQLTYSASDKRYATWATDRKSLLFRTDNNAAFAVNVNTGKETRILTRFGRVNNPVQSAIDCSYLFVRIGMDRKDVGDIWISDRNENNARILVRNVGLQYSPAWSPDGTMVAYTAGYGMEPRELSIVDVNNRAIRQITNNAALEILPAYSPDGQSIAYVSNITGDYEIWLLDLARGQSIQLTHSSTLDTRPCWSPDGQKIMFVSRRSGYMHLWIMNKDGSSPKQLTAGAECIDPAWRGKNAK